MSRVHMIRHGRPASTWGEIDPDPGLDAVGADQARAVARDLLALPEQERPSRVVSSPLRRCRETAQPLGKVTFSGGTCLMTLRIRSAIFCGVSIAAVRMSRTPTCNPVSFGRFFMKSIPAMSRLA